MVILIAALALGVAASAYATGTRIVVGSYSMGNWIPFWGPSKSAIRFQTLIDQDQIKYAGDITEVEYYGGYGDGGTFNNFELYLCHTDKFSLDGYFDGNYKGTPVLVASSSAFTIPARIGWFPLKMTKTFAYNDADNLLVEIRWEGRQAQGDPIITCFFGYGRHRIYAWSPKAEVASGGSDLAYFCRLSFGVYPGVRATSLGRVKALFR
jgi:hypothetical protein